MLCTKLQYSDTSDTSLTAEPASSDCVTIKIEETDEVPASEEPPIKKQK